jgi:hypothetical protein
MRLIWDRAGTDVPRDTPVTPLRPHVISMNPRPTPPEHLCACPRCQAPLTVTDARFWGTGDDPTTDRWVLTLSCADAHEFAWWEGLPEVLPRQ